MLCPGHLWKSLELSGRVAVLSRRVMRPPMRAQRWPPQPSRKLTCNTLVRPGSAPFAAQDHASNASWSATCGKNSCNFMPSRHWVCIITKAAKRDESPAMARCSSKSTLGKHAHLCHPSVL